MNVKKILIISFLVGSHIGQQATAATQLSSGAFSGSSAQLNKDSTPTVTIVDIFGKGTGSYKPEQEKITVCTQYTNVIKISSDDIKGFNPPTGLVPCGKTTDLKFVFYGKPVAAGVNTGKDVKGDPRF